MTAESDSQKRALALRRMTQRSYGFLKSILSVYGTLLTVAQLLPVLFGFALVALTPQAWLSETLRRWTYGGILVGSLMGIVALFFILRRRQSGWLLSAVLALLAFSAGLLRFHLALSSVTFSERWTGFQILYDFYLGTGDWQQQLYNALAALGFAGILFSITLLTALLVQRRKARGAAATSADAKPDFAALDKAVQTLTTGIADAKALNARLAEENEQLRRQLERQKKRLGAVESARASGPKTPHETCS